MCCDSMHAVRCGLWSIVKRLYVLYRASPFRDVRASVDCYGWSPLHECILQTQCICTGHSLTVFLCINNVRTSPKKYWLSCLPYIPVVKHYGMRDWLPDGLWECHLGLHRPYTMVSCKLMQLILRCVTSPPVSANIEGKLFERTFCVWCRTNAER